MDEFILEVQTLVTEYGVADVSQLSIRLAIETFKDLRNYPKSWEDDKIILDMRKNIAKIAMATVEIDSKDGMENQTSHSENNITRQFSSSLMAYKGVCAMVTVL